jgi:prepilin-type N-terminal cleavage/methylation domain-containing protein
MHTEACRNRGVTKAFTATLRSAANNSAAQHGFTLVELLVGVALGSMVMSGMGALMMLSEVRASANIQRNFDSKDALNRATDLMRREAIFSRSIAVGSLNIPVGTSPIDDCSAVTPIVFVQHSNVNGVCYKSIAPSALPAVQRAIYKGPCVLVRVGPPYKPNDDLDSSAASNVQVLMDGLASNSRGCGSTSRTTNPAVFSEFRVTLGQINSNPDTILRNADITITMDSPRVSYGFSLRSPSSPAYDGNALYDLCTRNDTVGCAGNANLVTYHHKPLMGPTTQVINYTNPSKENLFYFEYPYSEYVLSQDSGSGTCTYSQCYVSRNGAAVIMNNVDGLIFADKEIRVFDP